jgi:hypothetical protein
LCRKQDTFASRLIMIEDPGPHTNGPNDEGVVSAEQICGFCQRPPGLVNKGSFLVEPLESY